MPRWRSRRTRCCPISIPIVLLRTSVISYGLTLLCKCLHRPSHGDAEGAFHGASGCVPRTHGSGAGDAWPPGGWRSEPGASATPWPLPDARDGRPAPGGHGRLRRGRCGPCFLPERPAPGFIPERTERQSDDESNGPGDRRATALVILPTSAPHDPGIAPKSPAVAAAREALERRGSGQRRYRNALVFVAPNITNIDAARQNAKRERAWQSILNDADLRDNLTRGTDERCGTGS